MTEASVPRDLGSPVRFFDGSNGRGPILDLGVDPVSADLPDLPEPEPSVLEAIAETGLDDPAQLALIGRDLEIVAEEIAIADEVSRTVIDDIPADPTAIDPVVADIDDGLPTAINRPSGKVPPA